MVRFPDGLRAQLAAAAKINRRSMNAELVIHLEAGLARQSVSLSPPQPNHPATLAA